MNGDLNVLSYSQSEKKEAKQQQKEFHSAISEKAWEILWKIPPVRKAGRGERGEKGKRKTSISITGRKVKTRENSRESEMMRSSRRRRRKITGRRRRRRKRWSGGTPEPPRALTTKKEQVCCYKNDKKLM